MRDAGNDGDFSASHDTDEQQLLHSANHPPAGTYLIYGRESTKIFLFCSSSFSCCKLRWYYIDLQLCCCCYCPFGQLARVCTVIRHLLPTPAPYQGAFKVVWDSNPSRDYLCLPSSQFKALLFGCWLLLAKGEATAATRSH